VKKNECDETLLYVRKLFEAGLDRSLATQYLPLVVDTGQVAMATLLLDLGASMSNIMRIHPRTLQLLLDRGFQLQPRQLRCFVRTNDLESAGKALQAGVRDETMLRFAVNNNRLPMVKLLLEYGSVPSPELWETVQNASNRKRIRALFAPFFPNQTDIQ